MRDLVVSMPLWSIAAVLFAFFSGVSLAARNVVKRRPDAEAQKAASEQANSLLTAVAATFAFFVGFAINVTWGAVTAGQLAVERQAVAVHQMARDLDNIADRAQAASLEDKLRVYATAVVQQDPEYLRRGRTEELPSAAPLDEFENALHVYVNSPTAAQWQAPTLIGAVSEVGSAAAGVEAVANRALPRPLATLLIVVGILTSIVMGVTTVVYPRPTMIYVWCLIPAISITIVLALAYPFAVRSGINLTPMKTVAAHLE